jgi:predicted nucleic acid-binding protein
VSEFAFLDSGAIYALADRNDLDHRVVREVYANAAWRFVTHENILVEAFSLLTKRLHKHAAIQVVGALRRSPRVEIIPVAPRLLEAGWLRCLRFRDKDWDWVDCISFEVMEARRIRNALTLDHHFRQAGFVVLVDQISL